VAAALVLLGTNALHPGAQRTQRRHFFYGDLPIRSTLADYVREIAHPWESSNAAVSTVLAGFPAGTSLWTNPFALSTSSMFALPHLRFCGQVPDDFKKQSARAAALPAHVFWSSPPPDLLLVLVDQVVVRGDDVELKGVDSFLRERVFSLLSSGDYRPRERLPIVGCDDTRPEIPYRLFWPPPADKLRASTAWLLILERKAPERR
jgi:hypothetical protein